MCISILFLIHKKWAKPLEILLTKKIWKYWLTIIFVYLLNFQLYLYIIKYWLIIWKYNFILYVWFRARIAWVYGNLLRLLYFFKKYHRIVILIITIQYNISFVIVNLYIQYHYTLYFSILIEVWMCVCMSVSMVYKLLQNQLNSENY